MRLRDLKRFVQALLPGVHITGSRTFARIGNGALQGMAWIGPDSTPMIVYAHGMTERERDLTILHDGAHHVLGDTRLRAPAMRGGPVIEQWREDRADRWEERMREILQAD